MPIDLSKMGKGAIVQPLKRKDYRLETVVGAVILPSKFSLRDKIGKIKNQGESLSCVGQSFAYYGEALDRIEVNDNTELSARDIYSLIYQPEGGAYAKDGADKICNSGIVLEKDAPSYKNGMPMSENDMRWRNDINEEEVENGKTYLAKNYVTWDNKNIELFKQAIVQGNGCVIISWGNNYLWANASILLPDSPSQMVWRHQVYLIGYDDNKKVFEFVNSWGKEWGDVGFGCLPYEYITRGYVANPITLIDVPNLTYVTMTSQIINLQQIIIKFLQDLINKLKGRS